MTGLPSWARGFACLVLSFCACGQEALTVDYGCGDIALGDLVLTEIHANPDGPDGDREYIELFNASPASLSLEGITVMASRADGGSPKSHRLLEGELDSGAYFVAGNASDTALIGHIDYSYGSALGSLRNSDGSVSIWCGDRLIDRVSYAETTDGRAQELDGDLAPHHETNDDPNAWCATPEGVVGLGDGSFGTPGRRNSPCAAASLEETCVDGGLARAVVAPRPEDVRITEWMANPEGLDVDFEWVEVTFDAEADLNGLQLGPSPEDLGVAIDGNACFPVDAGAQVVFGASPAAAPRVDAELGFTLGNTGSRSIAVALGGVVLDVVSYEATIEGSAWQVDEGSGLCLAGASDEYASGNLGTPGEPNPPCPPIVEKGMCLDDGVSRRIVSPSVGQARITEWMADSVAVENRSGEWVEVRLDAPVDLNGLTLTDLTDAEATMESDHCLAVPAGAHVVWARSFNPSVNGGVDGVSAELSLSLNNQNETITLSVGAEVLDSVTYARSEAGVATQVDPLGTVCMASTRYGDGDLGTPGSPNPSCI